MAGVSDSRMAAYEGVIALAWADHELHKDEREQLHAMIDGNSGFSDEQRQKLHDDVNRKIDIREVWPRITSRQDRTWMLNAANILFKQDGGMCSSEQELFALLGATPLGEALDKEQLREATQAAWQRHQEDQTMFDRLGASLAQNSVVERVKKIFGN